MLREGGREGGRVRGAEGEGEEERERGNYHEQSLDNCMLLLNELVDIN